jgi:hypothetical protein
MPKTTDNIAYMALATFAAAALVATMTPPSAYAQTSQLTVNSQLANGTVITGYQTEVIDSTGTSQPIQYTPATFTLNTGEKYFIGVADWLNYFFDYWQDTESTDRWRSETITADTELIAIYRVEEPPVEDSPPEEEGEENIRVNSDSGSADVTNAALRVYTGNLAAGMSVYGGENSNVPETNLSGYELPNGSKVMDYVSIYELAQGIVISDIMTGADRAGLEWNKLTEAQQCFLVVAFGLGVPLDESGHPL